MNFPVELIICECCGKAVRPVVRLQCFINKRVAACAYFIDLMQYKILGCISLVCQGCW